MPAILICHDQPDVLIALQLLLKAAGYEAQTADSPHRLLEQLAARRYDMVLTDMNFSRDTTSGREGLDLVLRPDNELVCHVARTSVRVDLQVRAFQ